MPSDTVENFAFGAGSSFFKKGQGLSALPLPKFTDAPKMQNILHFLGKRIYLCANA
jgi:hypothetical protein